MLAVSDDNIQPLQQTVAADPAAHQPSALQLLHDANVQVGSDLFQSLTVAGTVPPLDYLYPLFQKYYSS